jgi:hypothetical protein
LRPSNHTLLINAVIAMCKENSNWIHPLADLGFEVRLIEQTMSLTGGTGSIKPDVVVTSNRHLHALLFDCKGGRNVDEKQADRYRKVTPEDILRWIAIWRPERLAHDVCFLSLESNRVDRTDKFKDFPLLVLSEQSLRKIGSFSNSHVEKKFQQPISIEKEMKQPMSYYPFSDQDDQAVILPFVLRAIVAHLMDKRRGGNVEVNEAMLDNEEMMRKLHPMWQLISLEQQRVIRTKVRDILRTILRHHQDFVSKLQGVEPHADIPVILANLVETCEKMIAEEEKKTRITDYPTE